MRTPHTSAKRGKKIYLTLRNGEKHVVKFVERTGKFVVFEKLGKVRVDEIRAFSIWRGQHVPDVSVQVNG